jgi:hypothetical protein
VAWSVATSSRMPEMNALVSDGLIRNNRDPHAVHGRVRTGQSLRRRKAARRLRTDGKPVMRAISA